MNGREDEKEDNMKETHLTHVPLDLIEAEKLFAEAGKFHCKFPL